MRTFAILGLAASAATGLAAAPADAGGLLAPIWSGAYIGLDAGAGWSTVETDLLTKSLDLAGLAGGMHAGYNFQLGQLVIGAEGDAMLTGASGSLAGPLGLSLTDEVNWIASLRGRVGLAFGPVLAYGTGGIAWAESTYGIHQNGAKLYEVKHIGTGFVAGGGLEAKIMPNASVRIEALHYMFGKEAYTVSGLIGNTPFSTNGILDSSFTVVRAGVSIGF